MVSLILSAPVILYRVWAFIAPALYKHERRLVVPLLVSSSLLFYIGMAFAYFVVFPLAFGFLTHTAPEGYRFRQISPAILALSWRFYGLWRSL